jgi:hypothetical protein
MHNFHRSWRQFLRYPIRDAVFQQLTLGPFICTGHSLGMRESESTTTAAPVYVHVTTRNTAGNASVLY